MGENTGHNGINGINGTDERRTVTIETPVADIVRWDQEERFVVFAFEKGRFKDLDEATLRGMSRATRQAWHIARDLNAKHDPGMDGRSDDFEVLGPIGSLGGQYETEVKPGLVKRETRPDRLYKRLNDGWRVAKPEDVVQTQAFRNEGHFETKKPSDGTADQIVLVMGKDEYAKKMRKREEARAAVAGERKSELLEKAREVNPTAKLIDD